MTGAEEKSNYRALLSRDPRFDGRFFTGVVTTGIYCRPICPARTPKFENVRFYRCAAAAEEAGFRACRRCRPETSPGTPGWLGTSATVSRALRLIAQGGLDHSDVQSLASRLGVGPRHLRRLFAEHLGTSPAAIAQTRRTHFARQLIDQTSLPMTQVALQSGFASVRRFNTAIRSTFERTPTELRTRAQRGASAVSGNALSLKLPFRPPLEWDAMLGFLALRAIPGVESTDDGVYRRTIRIGNQTGTIDISSVEGKTHLGLNVCLGGSDHQLLQIVYGARRIFDLDADPLEISKQLRGDTMLRPLLRARPGLRVPGAWDRFELAVRAILGQQVSVKGATTMAGRLVRQCGTPLGDRGSRRLTHVFPTPAQLAKADLCEIGLTPKRAETIRGLAASVHDRTLDLDAPSTSGGVVERLVELPGIGPWTAGYIAMRGFHEPDAFASGDLGLRRSAAAHDGPPLTSRRLEAMAEAWRPWRAYAAMHLWMKPSSSESGRRKRATGTFES